MKINKKFVVVAAIAAAVSFWAAFAQTASAAVTTVQVGPGGSDTFSPANVTINVNDSVLWVWAGLDHSSTSGTNGTHADDNGVPSGLWDSGVNNQPFSFTNKFTSAGTFSYYCTIHHAFGMLGTVTVVGGSSPPSLAITSPANGAVFAAPANVNIQAGVTNGTASVTNVQFLANSTLLASENTGPFSTTANNLTTGSYALSAIAKDNGGLSATNTVNISVVTPIAVTLTNSTLSSGTNFQFTYGANVGLNYVIERANSLVPPNWVPIATNVAASNPTNFVDTNATNNPGFYRVGRLPNP